MSGPDLSVVTGAVEFATVVSALVSVAAALCVAYVVKVGARMLLRAVRGDGYGDLTYDYDDYVREHAGRIPDSEFMSRAEWDKYNP